MTANFQQEYQRAEEGAYQETGTKFFAQAMEETGVLGESRLGQEATGLPIPTLQVVLE